MSLSPSLFYSSSVSQTEQGYIPFRSGSLSALSKFVFSVLAVIVLGSSVNTVSAQSGTSAPLYPGRVYDGSGNLIRVGNVGGSIEGSACMITGSITNPADIPQCAIIPSQRPLRPRRVVPLDFVSGYIMDSQGKPVRTSVYDDTNNQGLWCWDTSFTHTSGTHLSCTVVPPVASVPEAVPAVTASVPVPVPVPAPAPVSVPPPVVVPAPVPTPAPSAPVQYKAMIPALALFDFGKHALRPDSRQLLDTLIDHLKGISIEVITVVGHTDSIGGLDYNYKLSVKRAESVKAYLVSKDIPAVRIYTDGKGKTKPIADNKTSEGRARNRRVEIEAYGTRRP